MGERQMEGKLTKLPWESWAQVKVEQLVRVRKALAEVGSSFIRIDLQELRVHSD